MLRASRYSGAGRLLRPAGVSLLPASRIGLIGPQALARKRILDLAFCLVALPPALTLMAVCAALIWLDSRGPIVFGQWRTGRAGRRFRMYKFRTMCADAEQLRESYSHLNGLKWPDFKISADPRVTRIGRWLRRTSLDELPQLFNVLKGEMSLVGPRPTSFDVANYALSHTERLEVLPGITGLWQISGRADVDFDRRVALDIQYIARWSMWLDFCILARTLPVVIGQRGAY